MMSIAKLKSAGLVLSFLLLGITVAVAQTVVTGKVTDKNNNPLPEVSVVVKEVKGGTATDANGNFKLTVPTGGKTLVFTSVGYQAQEAAVGSQVNVSMKVYSKELTEAVVVGYGTRKKGDLTASIVSVGAKDFQKGAITTPDQLIAGKVAGVSVVSNGGAPGAGSTIRIRGGASLNASNDPLIVIDGVPVSNSGIAGSPNPLSLINPNDIDNFTVLKDAAATAIYGARASNGVILITTKKGKKGGPVVSFSSVNSLSKAERTADVMSAAEFSAYVKANGTPAQIAQLGTANTNWQNEIYSSAFTTDNNISVSGVTYKVPYRLSLGYLNQEGILNTDKLNRASVGLNVNPRFLNDYLKVDVGVKFANTNTHFADRGAIGSAVSFNPTFPVMSGNARYGGYTQWLDPTSNNGLRGLAPRNPVGLLNQRDDDGKSNRILANILLDYKMHFLPDLRAVVNVAIDKSNGSGTIVVSDSAATAYRIASTATPGSFGYGVNNQYKQESTNGTTEAYLNYSKDIKSIKSRIDVTAGTSYQTFKTTNTFFDNVAKNGILMNKKDFDFDIQENRLFSYFGRLGWTLNNKYLFNVNARRDYSSRFSPVNRFGDFYGASFAWKLKEESFLKNVDFINDLKLRAGYGQIGNQEGLGNYDYLSFYNVSGSQAQYQFGSNYFNMYRPGAYDGGRKWETTANLNLGLDFQLASNRINGSIDVYKKTTSDLLAPKTQPAGSNFANIITANIGSLENRGVELALNLIPIRKKDFSVELNFNATYNKNEITKLTEVNDPNFPGFEVGGISGGTGNTIQIHTVGFPRASYYVYKQVYDNVTGKPIENVFVDLNGDGVITDKDRYRYKNPDPNWFFGFSPNVTYKQWNVGMVFRAAIGNYVYNNVASSTGVQRNVLNPLGFLGNGSRNLLESGFVGTGSRYFLSDYYMENASFLRMDNIAIGYNAGRLFKNLNANFRFSGTVQNVFVTTNYTGIDPEVNGGIDNTIYARPRVFSVGVNVDFDLKKKN